MQYYVIYKLIQSKSFLYECILQMIKYIQTLSIESAIKQKRSTEGCSKLKSLETRQVEVDYILPWPL